jgi:hypothetical protein
MMTGQLPEWAGRDAAQKGKIMFDERRTLPPGSAPGMRRDSGVVVDPGLPQSAKIELQSMPYGELIPFSWPSPPVCRRIRPGSRYKLRALAIAAAASGGGAVLFLFLVLPGQDLNKTQSLSPSPAAAAVHQLAFLACLLAFAAFMIIIQQGRTRDRVSRPLTRTVRACHRRYVVPERDVHPAWQGVWAQAVGAARQIQESEVVRRRLIDTVEISVVLPHHLWEIAHRLALLSALRWQREDAMRNLDHRDPEVRAVLDPQLQADGLAAEDIERRVKTLTDFSGLVTRADEARKRERSIRKLADLNPQHYEMLAQLGGTCNEMSATGPVPDQLRDLINQADQAVQQANEAGRSLVIPDHWRADG